jgi:alkylation response protein AidB-like acyl-CoA dehydrogenase
VPVGKTVPVDVRWEPAEALDTTDALSSGLADAGGVPRFGRRHEHERLRAAGAASLPWGRLYEGHVNALQLIGRLGTERQRLRAEDDVAHGRLFGVWNTQAADGVRVTAVDAYGVTIAGRRTFASGAGRVARAIISIGWPDGTAQLATVPMNRVRTTIDRSFWRPYGMEDSDSFAVDFEGVRLESADLLGGAGDYERSPWLTAGASRFVAVQTGGIEQLVADFGAFLRRREQHADPIQLTRFGECVIAARTALLWTNACVEAWMRYDAAPGEVTEAELLVTVDAARSAVERSALDVAERIERGAGARGLLESEPFARRLRDLRMYLRQPAIDATLLRVAGASLTPRAIN